MTETETPPAKNLARYIMIGGFLGAGKTTVMAHLARHLTGRNLKVGLITNDQGSGLVDTTILRSQGFPTQEITGGCFCCRFNSLVDAARRLTDESRPEVFLAEPVGSCTDLLATVSYPLRRIYGDRYRIAPLSTLVDPIRARRILDLEPGARFSEKVRYIYRKQLEEAQLIVINKTDLLSAKDLQELTDRLAQEFPRARILSICARRRANLIPWFDLLTETTQPGLPTMELDYDRYAEGEALLGWLNATVRLQSAAELDGNELIVELTAILQQQVTDLDSEIAHLKLTLSTQSGLEALASVNVVRHDLVPELGQRLETPIRTGELIINLRAETDPKALEKIVRSSLTSLAKRRNVILAVEDLECFRPGRPTPTFREEAVG